ncbi:replicative DNA helicase [candidate division WS5 bacterium]|uniref:Replicative DNA helicase n=1 Tax=candidate division WS5 bacterium TaxID=2093353 RepID=A0A419DEI9_9BACT|nr:MAG: replicative DNA helicase [candidate division WS5 bacterium]
MAKEAEGRIPPHNEEAEVSVLGAILLEKDAIIKVADILNEDDFYSDTHRIIYANMVELFEEHQPIDLITLTEKLKKKKVLEEVGGAGYISTLVNSVPSAANIVHYAKIIADKALLRRLIESSSSITNLAYNEKEDTSKVLDEAEQRIFQVAEKHLKGKFISIKNILEDSFERIDELHKDKDKLRGIPTGFKGLDNILAGLQPSDLIVIAARPSVGKTSLALNIAEYVAGKEGTPVALFSLEMSKEQLVDRLLASEAKVDSWKLRTGHLDDDDFPKIGRAMATLSEAPLFIDDSPLINVLEMRTKARRLQAEKGLGLIIIDYLQLMQGKNPENRVQEISAISRELKGLARELSVPVIALSQLSRAVEARPDKRPILSDLRESGSIEQDADVVMFIYRDELYNSDTEKKGIAEVIIRKHRNGPIGSVELFFREEQTAFRNIDKKHAEN